MSPLCSMYVCFFPVQDAPDEIILIWIKALSLNMCFEFYRQAGPDYNAS